MTGTATLTHTSPLASVKHGALWLLSTVGTVTVIVLSAMAALVLAFGIFILGSLAFIALWAKSKLRKMPKPTADNGVVLEAYETPQGWKVTL